MYGISIFRFYEVNEKDVNDQVLGKMHAQYCVICNHLFHLNLHIIYQEYITLDKDLYVYIPDRRKKFISPFDWKKVNPLILLCIPIKIDCGTNVMYIFCTKM